MPLRKFAILLSLSLSAQISQAEDWPTWLGANHHGHSMESAWEAENIDNIQWRAEIGIGFSSVTVSDGKLYGIGHNGDKGKGGKETIYCLDAITGKEIWKSSYAAKLLPRLHEGGPAATPTVHSGEIFTLSKDGRLVCTDASSGDRKWERDLLMDSDMEEPAEWGFASSPVISGYQVIVEAARTIAFNLDSGKPTWKSEPYKPAYGTPTAFEFGGKSYLATVKTDGLVILDAKDGKTVAFNEWKTRFSTNASTPIVRGDKIFISTGYKRGCGLFKFTGDALEEVYTSDSMSNHMANCVLVGDHLYGFDGNTHTGQTRQLRCIDFSTGKVRWSQNGFGIGALCAAGDRLIILSEKGELVVAAATAEKFSPIERAQVSTGKHWNVPVLANGFIYVRNAAGKLVAIDVRK